jgi:hypothetical protein
VPDDLLRFVSGPTPYSPWWLWLGLALIFIVIAWYATVFVWTMSSARLRRIPVIRSVHAEVLRRRFIRYIRRIDVCHRAGELSKAEAGMQISRALRSFLHQATGTPAQYMHVEAIFGSDLAAAGPLLSKLNDVQFNTGSPAKISDVGEAAEELIRAWS